MKREKFTYGQLNRALSLLGVSRRSLKDDPRANVYEHPEWGLITILPALPESDRVYSHHFAAVRFLLDQLGIIDAKDFDAELQKAG